MTGDTGVLTLPEATRGRFERNTIRQAFCEFRFPTLPDLANGPPRDFVMKIRREFPHYEQTVGLKIGMTDHGVEQVPEGTHRFTSRNRSSMTWIRNSSLGVEMSKYVDFEAFAGKVETVIDAVRPTLDTDFFTRVGLRYINVLPMEPDEGAELAGWVNSDLLGPLRSGVLGTVSHHWCEIRGATNIGGYTFRHGLADLQGEGIRYILDSDFFAEGVDWDNGLAILSEFNAINFRWYSWAIGDKTRESLGSFEAKQE